MSNIPDWLVSNHNAAPVFHHIDNSLELLLDNGNGLASLAFLEALSAAKDYADATIDSSLGLAGNKLHSSAQI
jgi:hypothetical protein